MAMNFWPSAKDLDICEDDACLHLDCEASRLLLLMHCTKCQAMMRAGDLYYAETIQGVGLTYFHRDCLGSGLRRAQDKKAGRA